MLTKADIKALRRHETFLGKAVDWFVVILPVCLLIMANVNLTLCANLASDAGTNLAGVVQTWLHGVDGSTRYPGTFIMALDLFRSVVMELASALVLVVVAFSYQATERMNARIVDVLRENSSLTAE